MYVVVHHHVTNAEVAAPRGERLIKGEGAPSGVKVLQFYPAADGPIITCLWESPTVEAVREYVDETLGGSSTNIWYAVDAEQAFARQPLGIREQSPIAS